MNFKLRVCCLMFIPCVSVFGATSEWGLEGSIGGSPAAYYQEEVKKQESNDRNQVSGMRHALSLTAKAYYEWIGFRFWSDTYFSGTGKQKIQYQIQGPGNSSTFVSQENQGVTYTGIQNWRGELQLRQFYYGHREFFSLNVGLLYRSATSDLTGTNTSSLQSLVTRYLTVGLSFEPLLTNFGRYELSLPIDLSVGFKFPEGGLKEGGGPGAVHFGTGVRLAFEPRGPFITAQGVLNWHSMPYTTGTSKYTFEQVEIAMRLMVGYYFRNQAYNE